jgi:hypothetical protein
MIIAGCELMGDFDDEVEQFFCFRDFERDGFSRVVAWMR